MQWLLWAQAHVGQACVIAAGAATIIGTLRNVLTQIGAIGPSAGGKLGKVADRLSWVAEHGKQGVAGGWLALPGMASKPPAPSAQVLPIDGGKQ